MPKRLEHTDLRLPYARPEVEPMELILEGAFLEGSLESGDITAPGYGNEIWY